MCVPRKLVCIPLFASVSLLFHSFICCCCFFLFRCAHFTNTVRPYLTIHVYDFCGNIYTHDNASKKKCKEKAWYIPKINPHTTYRVTLARAGLFYINHSPYSKSIGANGPYCNRCSNTMLLLPLTHTHTQSLTRDKQEYNVFFFIFIFLCFAVIFFSLKFLFRACNCR